MNFTDAEINNFPQELKNDLISTGGRKVALTKSNTKQIYTSLDGVDYTVTDENKEDIEKIKQEDLSKINAGQVSTMKMGSKEDGIWSGYGALFFSGSSSNGTEYVYSYLTYFNWSDTPNFFFADKIAMSYQNNATRTGSSGKYDFGTGNSTLSINTSSIYGISTSYSIPGPGYGYIKADVNIPKTQAGLTGLFNSAYGHPYLPSGISVSIAGYGSISLSGTGDKWYWDNTFTIGQAY
ncbi:hypothetical protein D3C75_789650 [compost metagenome]